jgi:hypothetical protein
MVSSMVMVLSSLLLAADAQPRAWVDKNGEKIAEATLLALEGSSVHLRTTEGETLVVSLDVLSDADRAYIVSTTPRRWTQKDGTTLEAVLVKWAGVQIHLKEKDGGHTHIIAADSLMPADRQFAEEQLRRMRLANPHFIRVLRNRRGEPESLETSIARYVPADQSAAKMTVDLVSVVHVGDGGYYEQLDEELKNYDVVLYELVAPKDDNVPGAGRRSKSTVGDIQRIIRDLLQFEYQLDAIDYSRPNFLHADVSPEELAAEMRKRGETPLSMFLKMLEDLQKSPLAESKPLTEEDLVLALFRFAKNPSLSLRRTMASQMEDVEGFVAVFEGETGSAILSGRNDAALKVLKEQIEAGKKNIAIFYGAGHMPDLEKKLQRDFGLKLEDERWFKAWDMRENATFGRNHEDSE